MWVIQEALAKSSAAESRIRADTEAAVESMRAAAGGAACSCSCTGRPAAAGDCRRCMLRRVAERLRDAGYNSALCTSKWTRSPDIPSGNPPLPIFFSNVPRQSSLIFFDETHDDHQNQERGVYKLRAFLVKGEDSIYVTRPCSRTCCKWLDY